MMDLNPVTDYLLFNTANSSKMNMQIIFFFLLLFLSTSIFCQQENKADLIDQSITKENPEFGNNVFINFKPDQDQKNITITSAPNGWLFASYWYSMNNVPYFVILRSIDKGKTWITLRDEVAGVVNQILTKLQIIVQGVDTASYKLFFTGIIKGVTSTGASGFVLRLNSLTGATESFLMFDDFWDIEIASDLLYPASNSNPFSLAVVVSKYTGIGDSIIVYTSSDGGMSLNSHYNVGFSRKRLCNVSISYARSFSFSSGRYFVTWEEKQNANSPTGRIFTSHSEPNFNSPFTPPQRIDSIYPFTANILTRPVISTQAGSIDNNQGNLTELVVCQKFNNATNRFDLVGFGNKTAASAPNYQYFTIDSSAHNNIYPDVCYNNFDSTFMLTYVDSTNYRLPLLIKGVNLISPGYWNVVSNNYNIANILSAPNPKITLSYTEQSAAFAWLSDQSNGKRAAMFDAQFNFPVGVNERKSGYYFSGPLEINPNPTSGICKISIPVAFLNEPELSLYIYDLTGKLLEKVQIHHENDKFRYSISAKSEGSYQVILTNDKRYYIGKIIFKK